MNRIPRAAKKLDVVFLLDSNVGAGNHMIAEKTEDGWHGVDDSGKRWRLFLSHLRNDQLCRIKVLA